MKTELSEQIRLLEDLLKTRTGAGRQTEYLQWMQTEGATDEDLDRIEMHFGVKLPGDFRDFYKYKNGSGYHYHVLYPGFDDGAMEPYYLYSVAEIMENKEKYWMNDWPMSEYFSEEECADHDPRIKPYLRYHRWLPFAQLAGGDLFLLLDFEPTEEGKTGQIITYIHDPDYVYFVADNFTDMLVGSNINLKNNIDKIDY